MKRPEMIVHGEAPLNLETPPATLAAGHLTPVDAFYVRTHGPVPSDVAPLRVTGLVAHELSVSLTELRARFPERELTATLQCAGNRRAGLIAVRDIPGEAPWGPGATGTARWHGAALRDVLAAAGLRDDARHVELIGADLTEEDEVFTASITRQKALAGEVLLAWAMNGEPLEPLHGAPLRAVVPGYIGARSVKWLERIVARADPSPGHYQATAYRLARAGEPGATGIPIGAVAVNADILVPGDGARVPAGTVEVAGYAFAGDDRHIVRVDVSADGGATWAEAELLGPPDPWVWRRWRAAVDLSPGPATIVARAWDSALATQPEDPATVWNPKGYVNNSWARVSLRAA